MVAELLVRFEHIETGLAPQAIGFIFSFKALTRVDRDKTSVIRRHLVADVEKCEDKRVSSGGD